MKKQILLALILATATTVFSQVNDSLRNIRLHNMTISNNLRVIPASKATTIRRDFKGLQGQMRILDDSVSVLNKDIESAISAMKTDLDAMSEMGELESLRLQMAMDRMSKMMSTISNILKKISDTQQSITQNMK